MTFRPTLLTNGDSWTFGSEIAAPELLVEPGHKGHGMGYRFRKGCSDIDEANDYYRIPRIWPTILAQRLGYDNINLAWPARSNDGIYESTVSYIISNYIKPGRSVNDLLVVIGWSSPERKDLMISAANTTYLQTIWPAMSNVSFYAHDVVRQYFKFHVNHLWVEQEYIGRYVEHNYNLACFLERHGISYYFFNAFYQTPNKSPSGWESMNVGQAIASWEETTNLDGWCDPWVNWREKITRLANQWHMVCDKRFILKDRGSFKEYIDQQVPSDIRMINWHPSPESHQAWADFLHKYITSGETKKINRFRDLMR